MRINRAILVSLGVLCLAALVILFVGALTAHAGLFQAGIEMTKLTFTGTLGALAGQIRVAAP